MGWAILSTSVVAIAGALYAVRGGVTGPATQGERLLCLGGGVGCAVFYFLWWYFGRLPALCETSCVSESLQHLFYVTAIILASLTVAPAGLKLLATGVMGDLRFARKTWIFVSVGVVAFASWFILWGVVFDAARPSYP
jgi:hypothetical protein